MPKLLDPLMSFVVVLAALAAHGAPQAQPATYPAKPIRMVAPSLPGSPPDLVARAISAPLGAALGQPVVVENRSGATGTIGLAEVAKAAPDGHTVGVLGMPFIIAPRLYAKVPYDTIRDLAPVRQVAWNAQILVVRSDAPWRSLDELLAAARATPGALTFASGGNATPPHLIGEALKQRAAIDVRHIPFKGAAGGIAAVMGQQVDFMFAAAAAASGPVKGGKLRALGAVSPVRLAAHPELPTLRELGHEGLEVHDWYGIVAPAGTPAIIIERLARELDELTRGGAAAARLSSLMMAPATRSSPEEFAAFIRAELTKWEKVVSETGIRAD